MESTSHRGRRVAAATIGLVLAVATVAACTHTWPRRPPTTTTGTTGSTSPSTHGTQPTATDCGTIAAASGWPTTTVTNWNGGPGKCFLDAWAAGRPATLVLREQTDGQGGHIKITTYEVLGANRLLVTTDATGMDPPGGVTQAECQNITTGTTSLQAGLCERLPKGAPAWDGPLCGTIAYASGWPTTPPVNLNFAQGKCFLDAWDAGTRARLVTREQTDGQGGHIAITTYDVIGPGQLNVYTDRRQALSPGGVTAERCTGLTHDMSQLHPEGCSPL